MQTAQTLCRRILDDLANQENHAVLHSLIDKGFAIDEAPVTVARRGPLLLLDLLNTYREFLPDLRFCVDEQSIDGSDVVTRWSAQGRHVGFALNRPPTGRSVHLAGSLRARVSPRGIPKVTGTWDIGSFIRQIGITADQFVASLNRSADDVRLRSTSGHDGVPIVLFPTMTLPGWMTWRRIADGLKQSRPVISFQLIANRLAFERLDVPPAYSVKSETRATARALERAGVPGPFDLIGHSAGGTLALDFALDHPDRTRSLTLIEPSAAWVLEPAGRLTPDLRRRVADRLTSYAAPVTTRAYEAFLKQTVLEKDYAPRASPQWPLLCAYRRNMRFRSRLYVHSDRLERLRSVSCPTLLIRGRQSDDLHHEIARVLQDTIPQSTLIELPGGHVPHYRDGAARVLEVIESFLANVTDSCLMKA